jgi:pimeloyl-ACP methyl ester carboxylesterase
MMVYFRNYFCRAEPFPPEELLLAFKNMSEDTTVRDAMSVLFLFMVVVTRTFTDFSFSRGGQSPLSCTGSFRDWTCIPRLHQIAVPTVVYNGEFDTSHDVTVVPFFKLIPRVRWITFPGAGHMCHLERPELADRVIRMVGEFLTQGEK